MKIVKYIVYLSVLIVLLITFTMNFPYFYEKLSIDMFEFYSDVKSIEDGIKYEDCLISSIDNSLQKDFRVYFGCYSPELEYLPNPIKNIGDHMVSMTRENFLQFDNLSLDGNFPIYLVVFPFKTQDISKSSVFYLNKTAQTVEKIQTVPLPIGNFKDNDKTFIVEYRETPRRLHFNFMVPSQLKMTAYEKWESNYFYSSHGLFYIENDIAEMRLKYNAPSKLLIELLIPLKYKIECEKCEITSPANSNLKYDYLRVIIEVMPNEIYHIAIVDIDREIIKTIFNFVSGTFLIVILIDIIMRKIKKK